MNERIVVWGAGSTGGLIGALLHRAGQDVLMVDNDTAHVQAIRETGLAIEGPVDQFCVPVPALHPDEMKERFGILILAVQARDTSAALRRAYRNLREDGFVLPVQNGVNTQLVAQLVGAQRTLGALVNFLSVRERPGQVTFLARGSVVVGELDGQITPRVGAIAQALQAVDPSVVTTDNIKGHVWGHLGFQTLMYATAITGEPVASCLLREDLRGLFHRLGSEVMAAASLGRVRPEGFAGFNPGAFHPGAELTHVISTLEAIVADAQAHGREHSSAWADLTVHHRRTEARAHLGAVIDAALRCGLEVPLVRRLLAILREVEAGRRPIALANMDELVRALDPTAEQLRN